MGEMFIDGSTPQLTPEQRLAQAERVSQSINTSLDMLQLPSEASKQVYEILAKNLSHMEARKMQEILYAYEEKKKNEEAIHNPE